MRPLPIQRRQFLKTADIAPLAVLLGNLSAASDLDARFKASSPEVMALARRVMEKIMRPSTRAT